MAQERKKLYVEPLRDWKHCLEKLRQHEAKSDIYKLAIEKYECCFSNSFIYNKTFREKHRDLAESKAIQRMNVSGVFYFLA